MNVDEVLDTVEQSLLSRQVSSLERLILCQSWLGHAYRTYLRSMAVSVSPVGYGLGIFCHHRPMISRLVAIELCETTCLSA